MIVITKQERDYLESQGCIWGDELHRTYSNKKTYYATESKKVLNLLSKYRKNKLAN